MLKTNCPICGASVQITEISEHSTFPFCSQRCRLVDLGRWLDERYRLSQPLSMSSEEEPSDGPDWPPPVR